MQQLKTDTFIATYFKATDAYRESEFNKYMDGLRVMNPKVDKYLEEEVGLYQWVRSLFLSHRYDM